MNTQQKTKIRMASPHTSGLNEEIATTFNGFSAALCIVFIVAITFPFVFVNGFITKFICGIIALGVFFCIRGFFILQPGDAIVFTFFGNYAGTCREEGFHFSNPFSERSKISIKANNLATATIKVNDANGNPIEIAASIVWVVSDTARAFCDIENYPQFARIQAESALRQVASSHPYDLQHESNQEQIDSNEVVSKSNSDHRTSLRTHMQQVTSELIGSIKEAFRRAGLDVLDAQITHLAYAPEIAQAMLRRQQAQQIVSARKQIVDGAVSLTEDVISKLAKSNLVTMSNDDRSRLVINLLTVLVSDTDAQPVLPMNPH